MGSEIAGILNLDGLHQAVREGQIDTMMVGLVDMQGRVVGKRIPAAFFWMKS